MREPIETEAQFQCFNLFLCHAIGKFSLLCALAYFNYFIRYNYKLVYY